jgi:hypothetical protein
MFQENVLSLFAGLKMEAAGSAPRLPTSWLRCLLSCREDGSSNFSETVIHFCKFNRHSISDDHYVSLNLN